MNQFHPSPPSLLRHRRHPREPSTSARGLMLGIVFGEATAALLLPVPRRSRRGSWLFVGFAGKKEPTSGLEPLICPLLRVNCQGVRLVPLRPQKPTIGPFSPFLSIPANR
jgi:hypothetical protein